MQRRDFLQRVGASLGLSLVPWKREAKAGGVFATEFTQLLNYAALALQLQQQINTYAATFSQWQQAVYEGRDLLLHPFTQIQQDLAGLANVVSQSRGLAYSLGNLDQQFRTQYPTFAAGQQPFFTAYANWSNNTWNSVSGMLQAVGLQSQQFGSEQAVLQQIQQMSHSPMARNEAIQLGNQISQEMVSQLVKLRQLMMSDMSAKGAYTGYQIQKEAATQQANQQAFTPSPWTSDQRGW